MRSGSLRFAEASLASEARGVPFKTPPAVTEECEEEYDGARPANANGDGRNNGHAARPGDSAAPPGEGMHGRSWSKIALGIGSGDDNLPSSRLIHPFSPFAIGWLMCTCAFLLYTACVTPAVISLHWLDGQCESSPTLLFDCVLDGFFLSDIVFTFFLGVVDGDHYRDDWKWVASTYLRGGFVFDLLTSIPVAFVELAIVTSWACVSASGGAAPTIDPSQVNRERQRNRAHWRCGVRWEGLDGAMRVPRGAKCT